MIAKTTSSIARRGSSRLHRLLPLKQLGTGAAIAATLLASSAVMAQAQAPIKMLIGFPTGGGLDPLARAVSEPLSARMSTPIIIDNRPGAGGAIAGQLLKRSAADGKTLMFTMDHQISVAPFTMKSVGYEVDKDFTPVAQIVSYDLCLAVNTSSKATTLKEFIDESKAAPEGKSIAIPAPGSAPQFLATMLNKEAGAKFKAVAYRGGGPAMVDLLGGHAPAAILPCRDFAEHSAKGTLRVLTVAGPHRLSWAPNVPRLLESGYNIDTNFWIGIYAPANLPQERLNELNAALTDVMAKPELQQRIRGLGFEPTLRKTKEFDQLVQATTSYWKNAIQVSGFTPE